MSQFGKLLPKYYDIFMGENDVLITPIKQLLKKYHATKGNLLELACGTGTVLKKLPKTYQLFGLDLSDEMLAQAKSKVPYATFFRQDMSNFSLPLSFDVVLCIFDSINHLETFSQWERLFKHTARHLAKGGIFIFDMNSITRLSILSGFPSLGKQVDKDMVSFQTYQLPQEGKFDLQFSFYQHLFWNLYRKKVEHVYEAAFDTKKVTKSLRKYFVVKEVVDLQIERISPDSKRVVFVCQKNRKK